MTHVLLSAKGERIASGEGPDFHRVAPDERVVRERPILFSAPMVRALLAGAKTQTRRVVKPQPAFITPFIGADNKPTHGFGLHFQSPHVINEHVWCPYGAPGDRLWVKESIRRVGSPEGEERWCSSEYIADGAQTAADCWPWKNRALPSIHMPRGLSRITLEVTGVRVEQLNAITEADAIAEGIEANTARENVQTFHVGFDFGWRNYDTSDPTNTYCVDAKDSYRSLWESINGPDSWAANPWVWVVEFKRVTP